MPKGLDGFWRLTPGMFGTKTSPAEVDVEKDFGFAYGHRCADPVISRACWHNKEGEFLGLGDVSCETLERVAAIIDSSQIFVVTMSSFRHSNNTDPKVLSYDASFAVYGRRIHYVDVGGRFGRGTAHILNVRAVVVSPEAFACELGVLFS